MHEPPDMYSSISFKAIRHLILIIAIIICFACLSTAGEDPKEVKIPETLHEGLNHLMQLGARQDNFAFQPNLVAEILKFVASSNPETSLYYVDKQLGESSAYYGFDLFIDLDHVLQVAYNPDIPAIACVPSSVRSSRWTGVQGQKQPLPKLWHLSATLKDPLIVRGVECVENTPDLFTGAYYAYDLDRTICLYEHQGRRVLLSLSKQKDISDVGKKGLVLGSDENWEYVYSGEAGLTKPGLGWVRSYMYDSYSIAVFYEIDRELPLIKFGIFKWIDAGWSGINVVKKKHIYRGLKRFGKPYKEILEHPSLLKTSEVANVFQDIQKLSTESLREKIRDYFEALKNHDDNNKVLSKNGFAKLFAEDSYVYRMGREEMQSILFLECMKCILGRDNQKKSVARPICERFLTLLSKS